MKIILTEYINSEFCVDTVDGQNVYHEISGAIDRNETVTISFTGVKRITTAFLNAAVGQLYNEFPEETIRKSIRFIEMAPNSQSALIKVIARAKRYFSNKDQFDAASKKAMEEN